MNGEFVIGDNHYIIIEDNGIIKLFVADRNGYPKSSELDLFPYNKIITQKYLDKSLVNLIKSFNEKCPVKMFSYSKGIIITQNNDICLLKREGNNFIIYKIKFKPFYRNVSESDINQSDGAGDENAKVKVKRHGGFANNLFMISLSCFSIGVMVALIIVIFNKFFV